jgi:hypothetical protein
VPPSLLKTAVARVGEKLGRLKLNGRLTSYSPLSRFEELELFSVGVEGKRLLWAILDDRADPRLAPFDFPALQRRSEEQRAEIEVHRRAAAQTAFTVPAPPA